MRNWIACTIVLGTALPAAAAGAPDSAPISASQLFDPQRVWDIELSLSASAWQELQPQSTDKPSAATPWSRFLGPEGGRNGAVASRGIEFDYVHADLRIDGQRFADVGLRYKGNSTYLRAQDNKKPLKIQLDRHVREQRLAGITTINLQNSVTDSSYMNEALAYRLYRDAGVPAPRTTYARVSLAIAGKPATHLGLYSITEGIEPEFFDGSNAAPGGALFKPSLQVPFTLLGEDWSDYRQAYDPKTRVSKEQQQRIIEFSRLVSHADDEEFAQRLGEYLDIDAFARYFAVLAWLGNRDSLLGMGQNYYVYMRPGDQRLIFLPWDQDGSFGNFRRPWNENAVGLDIAVPWRPGIRFLERAMSVPALRDAYYGYLMEFSRTLFLPERFAEQIGDLALAIRPAIRGESAAIVEAFESAVRGDTGILPFARQRANAVGMQLEALAAGPQ